MVVTSFSETVLQFMAMMVKLLAKFPEVATDFADFAFMQTHTQNLHCALFSRVHLKNKPSHGLLS